MTDQTNAAPRRFERTLEPLPNQPETDELQAWLTPWRAVPVDDTQSAEKDVRECVMVMHDVKSGSELGAAVMRHSSAHCCTVFRAGQIVFGQGFMWGHGMGLLYLFKQMAIEAEMLRAGDPIEAVNDRGL